MHTHEVGRNSPLIGWVGAFVVVLVMVGLSVPDASAMAMFARKYQTSCSTCHYAFPTLNAAGKAFKNNGYRFPNGTDNELRKDEPVSIGSEAQKRVWPDSIWPSDIPGGIPIGIQGIGRFNYVRNAQVQWTTEFPHEFELFLAGTLGDHFSFFGEAELENAGNEVEVAFPMWFQYDAFPALHVRMGAVETEPTKTGLRQTRNHYNTHSFRSRNGWRYRDENYGIEVWGATNGIGDRGGLTYHIGMVNGQGPFADLNPSKDFYTRVTYKFGGLGEAGGTGDAASATSKFYIDNSVTVGGFTYHGKARASNSTVDEDFDVVGLNVEAWLDRVLVESVLYQMDSQIPNQADRTSRVVYLQGSVVAFPWLIPFTRYEWEDANRALDSVRPVNSILAGVSTLPVANVKFILDYKRALDDLNRTRRNDNFTVQVNFSF